MAEAIVPAPDRRAALLEGLADHVLAHGLASASLRPLAEAMGTSDRMLLYYFKDKADLVGAILETIAGRMTALLAQLQALQPQPYDVMRARLTGMMLDDALWPYMRLWLELASRAASGDAMARTTGEGIARGFLALCEALLDTPRPTRRSDATRLLIAVEGAVLLKSLGLADEVKQTL